MGFALNHRYNPAVSRVWHLLFNPLDKSDNHMPQFIWHLRLLLDKSVSFDFISLYGVTRLQWFSNELPLPTCTQNKCKQVIYRYMQSQQYAWWRHQMETCSALLVFVRGIHRSPVNSPHKGQWREALVFSLICAWRNIWVNSRDAGELRRYRVHDVTVMWVQLGHNIPVRYVMHGHKISPKGHLQGHVSTFTSELVHLSHAISVRNIIGMFYNYRQSKPGSLTMP